MKEKQEREVMSSWREQRVLRMPATTIGIHTKEAWNAFYARLIKETDWGPGSFAPALCSYENGPMIDYILADYAPVEGRGYKMKSRILWYEEEEEYLPVFQKAFPGFTLDQMDEVHYCEYIWYDATEAPYCY